jgi:NAD-dependent SIR2 family protein deacetylase
MEKKFVCIICGEVISGKCYSSEPVVMRSVCCEKCRNEVVKPRIKLFLDAVFESELFENDRH